ncbi:hypothetical protein ANN_05553 [Periplaneta americana]|uniref:Uncharacterized protein n=1 Tax=Periplaneta americana TaxID=6978 RepID=A0ABQ8TDN3_PERAM|nr:hypothetical protein ANN_05553 [Periplaneta americana]
MNKNENTDIRKELRVEPLLEKLTENNNKCCEHPERMKNGRQLVQAKRYLYTNGKARRRYAKDEMGIGTGEAEAVDTNRFLRDSCLKESDEQLNSWYPGSFMLPCGKNHEENASQRLRWAGHVARMGESRNAYRVLVGRSEGKRPLRRPRRRWEDSIKMDLREVGYDDRDWLNLAQDRDRWRAYVRAAMNLRGLNQRAVQRSARTLKISAEFQSYDMKSDNAGEMSPESNTESYPTFAHLKLRENPGKNLNQYNALYSCETWTLTLREEQRLRVFENKVPRKIFGAKRDEVTGEWRKLHNAELHALHSSPDIIRNIKSRRLRWAGHVARMGESKNAYRVLVGIPEGKRPLGRPRRRWEDDIKKGI